MATSVVAIRRVRREKVAEGWSNIDYSPSLPMANYIGLCPDCCEFMSHWPVSETDEED
jgi:hypothetical protein